MMLLLQEIAGKLESQGTQHALGPGDLVQPQTGSSVVGYAK
jgi:hypothetical protein